MKIHTVQYEDQRGDLVDVDYQCSALCMFSALGEIGIETSDLAGERRLDEPGGGVSWGGWPGGSETDYDVYCSHCGVLLWEGMSP